MVIHIKDELEDEVEKIGSKLERDFGVKMSGVNTIRTIIKDYKKRHDS